MLDKGQELDWFGSPVITTLAVLAAIALIGLVVWEWFRDDPIVDVRLFTNLNFLGANVMMFMAGLMLFASLIMMPQILQGLLGYPAERAGFVLSGGGVLLLFLMPLAGMLTTRLQARHIIAVGWGLMSIAMYYSSQHLTPELSFGEASLLRMIQVLGLPLLFIPIITVSYVGLPAEKSNDIAGLVSFMRNIGASIGTSIVTTLIARGSQLHQVHLVTRTSDGQPAFADLLSGLTSQLALSGVELTDAAQRAHGLLYRTVIAQATTLAYVDTFRLLAAGAGVMCLLSFALQRNEPGGGPAVSSH
jgi:DHA2 family multidrug resistance protein